jgi:hypothetical protein
MKYLLTPAMLSSILFAGSVFAYCPSQLTSNDLVTLKDGKSLMKADPDDQKKAYLTQPRSADKKFQIDNLAYIGELASSDNKIRATLKDSSVVNATLEKCDYSTLIGKSPKAFSVLSSAELLYKGKFKVFDVFTDGSQTRIDPCKVNRGIANERPLLGSTQPEGFCTDLKLYSGNEQKLADLDSNPIFAKQPQLKAGFKQKLDESKETYERDLSRVLPIEALKNLPARTKFEQYIKDTCPETNMDTANK